MEVASVTADGAGSHSINLRKPCSRGQEPQPAGSGGRDFSLALSHPEQCLKGLSHKYTQACVAHVSLHSDELMLRDISPIRRGRVA